MELADHGGNDVGVFRVVVVARAVEVGGHDTTVVDAVAGAVLPVVAFAEFDAGNLGDGVGFVGGFQGAGEQGIFAHRLRGKFGIDATAAEEQQFLDADLGDSQVDLVGLLHFKEGAHGGLVGEVEFGVGAGDDVVLALRLQRADDGRADHAAMAGDVDF